MDGEVRSATFSENTIIYQDVDRPPSPKTTDTVLIKKRLDAAHCIVFNGRKRPPYALIRMKENVPKGTLKIDVLDKGVAIDSLDLIFEKKSFPSWTDLMAQQWYSASTLARLKQAPGLNEIKRQDMLTALQWRKALSEKIKAYLEDTGGARPFMIYRFVENYRNHKLVELGYNPYKRVPYNLQEQFKNDKEILRLLNEEIQF